MLFTDMEKKRMDKHNPKHNYKAYSPRWGLKCLLDFLVQFNVLPPKTPLQTWSFSGNSNSFGRMPGFSIWVFCVFASTENPEWPALETKLGDSLGKGIMHLLGHLP